MQRSWVMALIVGSGLLAQTPPPEPPPAPAPTAPAPEAKPQAPKPEEAKPETAKAPAEAVKPAAQEAAPAAAQEAKPATPEAKPATPEAKPFDQWRPTQRKYAYDLDRAVLAAHELGYYRSHPRAIEVRDALEALVGTKDALPDKAKEGLAPVEAYLAAFHANHGPYDAEGKKILMEGNWKGLRSLALAATKAGARTGDAATKGLEGRLARVRGLLFDSKVDAAAPTWAEPEAVKGKKARKAKAPRAPEGFHEQKAVLASWVKQAMHYVDDTPQEVEIKGEKKKRLLPDPVQTKALAGLVTWLDRDDLEVLRDPGMGWLDLRRLATGTGADQGRAGFGLLDHAGDIAGSKAPEGAAPALPLLPVLQPVMGESKFSKGDEKRAILAEVKLLPPAATLAEQMVAFEKLGRSREFDAK